MVNYIVDDLDALLDRLQQEGVKIDPKRMNESYGRFAWIYDADGNKIELWQPMTSRALRPSAHYQHQTGSSANAAQRRTGRYAIGRLTAVRRPRPAC